MCKLCHSDALLTQSHIFPKFIGRWLKDTAPTPYLRFAKDMDRRQQDLPTLPLLCKNCEQRFSVWETKFASEIFYPSVDAGESNFRYRAWLIKFAASLTWRCIHWFPTFAGRVESNKDVMLNDMEKHLRGFLLGEESSVGEYTQHMFPMRADSLDVEGRPGLSRYILRSVQTDLLGNEDLSEMMMYVKIPMFMFLSIGASKHRKDYDTSRIKKASLLHPQNYELYNGLLDYVVECSDNMREFSLSMSAKSRAASSKALMKAFAENPDKVHSSVGMQITLNDARRYGKKAVVYPDEE